MAPQEVKSGAAQLNLVDIVRGDDWALEVVIVDVFGSATDVSARSYVAEVDTLAGVAQVTMTIDTADAADGTIVLSLTDVETAALTEPVYWWDLKQTDAAGLLKTIFRGHLKPAKDLA